MLTQIKTCIQRFSHLDILTKYQYLTGITILIPPIDGDSLTPLLMVGNNTMQITYIAVQGWFETF